MRHAPLPVLLSPLLGLLGFAALGGCPANPDGEVVGTYNVSGSLLENSCGSTAFAAVDPLSFVVELRADPTGPAFWRRPNAPIVNGSHTGDDYRFRTEVPVTLYGPDETTGAPGCVLAQVETIEFNALATVADAGVGDAGLADAEITDAEIADAGTQGASDGGVVSPSDSFRGTSVIELTPVAGADCARAHSINGGPFLALPCRVRYDLSGAARSSVF